jgi:hypothetical protein
MTAPNGSSVEPEPMIQTAPYPEVLARLVGALRYKLGWHFGLSSIDRGQGSEGLTFQVWSQTQDAYHPLRQTHVAHYFIVPAAAYNERSWRRWILDRLIEIETHEACEFTRFMDDRGVEVRPWAPLHGPGNDPYFVYELSSDVERRTSFLGEVTT